MGPLHFLKCEEIIFPVPRGKMIDLGTMSSFFPDVKGYLSLPFWENYKK